MLTLAVDTAGEIGSLALVRDAELLEQVRLESPGGFAQALFGELDGLLARQGANIADVDLFAAANGPGSFTGVRIGLAAVKGLAAVSNKPALAISNLAAIAAFGTGDLRAAIIDARRNEVYAALFRAHGEIVIPPVVCAFQPFVELVGERGERERGERERGERNVEWISTASTGIPEAWPITPAPAELAAMIAKLALEHYHAGALSDPASIEADYVRRSDAEIFWKPQ